MNKETLKQYVLDNPRLVSMKASSNYPGLFVLKYKKCVFYDSLWNEYLEQCRGTIVDEDFNLVSYPFTKIYNYGIEKKAPVLNKDATVTAFRKINGFMVSVTAFNGTVLVSTTGSTDSNYIKMAKAMMLTHMCWEDWELAFAPVDMQGLTVMFECCHPNDPHIIPEKSGMYVLGYRENKWNSQVGHDPFLLQDLGRIFKCFVPESITTNLVRLEQIAKECQHEGYVVYTNDEQSFKIKSPYYLTLKWVARNPRTDKLVNLKRDIKKNIDEEYYNLIDAIRLNIVEYTAMTEQERLTWVRNQLEIA